MSQRQFTVRTGEAQRAYLSSIPNFLGYKRVGDKAYVGFKLGGFNLFIELTLTEAS